MGIGSHIWRSHGKGENFKPALGNKSHTGQKTPDDVRKKISNALKGKSTVRGKTPEIEIGRKQKLSKRIKERYEKGWMPKAGRCKKIEYYSKIAGKVFLDGGWELLVAKYFDGKNILWRRNKIKFPYINLKNKPSYYTPDFYLPDYKIYLEIKGYETELDRCKWKQFPFDLKVWKKNIIKKIKNGGEVDIGSATELC